jgi:hypothetical protein
MTLTTPRVTTQTNTPAAAVISNSETYWPTCMAPRPGADRARAVPPVLAVLDYAARAMATHSTIVYAGVRPPEDAPGAIREAGWKGWHAGPWTHYDRGGRTVAVGQLDDLDDTQPLFDTRTDPAAIAQRLQAFGQAIGYTWLGTCATTALGALRLTWENVAGKPLWHHACPIENPGSGAIIWSREPSAREAQQPAWSWDINGMYLAAAGGADVAYSTLEHTPHAGFDPRLPGYWLVSVPVVSPWEPPLVAADDLDRQGRAWLTTEAVKALRQRYGPRGALAQMHDSYTAAPIDGRVSCRVGRQVGRPVRASPHHPRIHPDRAGDQTDLRRRRRRDATRNDARVPARLVTHLDRPRQRQHDAPDLAGLRRAPGVARPGQHR